jgi:hypothetical protein
MILAILFYQKKMEISWRFLEGSMEFVWRFFVGVSLASAVRIVLSTGRVMECYRLLQHAQEI